MPYKEVAIEALRFQAVIGYYEDERKAPQDIVMDIKYGYDFDKSFIDYINVAELAKNRVIKKKFSLLEEAIDDLKNEINSTFPMIKTLQISISKPSVSDACTIKVTG